MQEYKHEFVVLEKNLPFKVFEFEGRFGNYLVPKHWHTEVEIICVIDGNIDFFINSNKYKLERGDALLVNSNTIHSVAAKYANKVIVLQIPKSTLQMYNGDANIHFTQIFDKKDNFLYQSIIDIYNINEKKEEGFIYSLLGRYYMLLEYLFRNCKLEIEENTTTQIDNISRLSEITDYILENCGREITLNEVAEKFGYTQSYLSKLFRKNTSINYKTYVDTIRLSRAYNELLNSDTTILDIAYNNGFANVKSFINIFKKRYGMTPHAYRLKTKNDNF